MIIKVFRHIYHFSIYTVAVITLTVAICVSLIRLALPTINEYRKDVQSLITEYMGQPVEIDKIDASWFGWIPHFYLHDISIFEEDGNEIIANFKTAEITIDIIKSIKRKQLVPGQLSISGLDLTMIRKKDGSINVSRTETGSGKKYIESTELAVWLLKQPRISLSNTQITVLDLTSDNNNPVLLSNVSLLLISNEYRLQIEGNANLPVELGDKINFAFDAKGDILTTVWSGELFIEGASIYPPAWFNRKLPFDININSKPGNIKIWSDWQNAKLRKIEGTIDITDVKITSSKEEFNIKHLVTAINLVRRTDNGVDLSLNIEKLETDNGSWPASTIYLSKYLSNNDQYRYISKSNYLKLDDISHLIKLFPELWRDNKLIAHQSLQGVLTHSLLIYDPELPDDQQYFVDSDIFLSSASFGSYEKSITGLNGHLQGTVQEGKFTINSNIIDVDLPQIIDKKIRLYEIDTEVNWLKEENNFVLTSNYFDAHTDDFNAYFKGKLVFKPDTRLPYANIVMGITDADIGNISNYLPINTPESARHWFANALAGGKLSSADIILRGNLEDYPYLNNEGQFKAIANFENVTLDYSPKWAPVDNMNAELVINKNKFQMNIVSGNIFNAEINNATATINDLSADQLVVNVDGSFKGHTDDGKLFIDQSPLNDNRALKLVRQNDINGEFNIDIKLDIPLGGGTKKFEGKIDFVNASLLSKVTNIKLENINGKVEFSNNVISANDLHAIYSDHEVILDVQSDINGLPVSHLSGIADKQFIIEQLTHFFPEFTKYSGPVGDRISGQCEWHVELSYPESGTIIENERKLVFKSTLNGLYLDFPAPLNKQSEPVNLEWSTVIDKTNKRKVDFSYGKFLTGVFDIDKSLPEKSIVTNLSFGEKNIQGNSEHDFNVVGNINTVNMSEWIKFLNELKLASNKESKTVSIDVVVSNLELMGQVFNDVDLKLENRDNEWTLNLGSRNINGIVMIPFDRTNNPVTANLDRLVMIKGESDEELNPKKLPALKISVIEFQYGDIKLGKFLLDTSIIEEGMSIDNFSFNKPGLDISGKGVWSYIDNQSQSSFAISLNAARIDNMLETFNYSVAAIEDGETNMKINANWDGAPTEFSLQKLNGGMQLSINKGQLLDIEPKAGRLFGLLSIQTLPRRLALDFSDLFSKGLSFDGISGDFTIEDGDAYTNNLSMAGPSAEIAVTGRTGLSKKDYDQLVTVTPQIADSLPIASALFGPIGVGVGAVLFLASEMFDSIPKQIDKLLRYQYTITGSWDNPVIEKLSSKQEPTENDPAIGIQKQNTSYLTQ